MIHDDFTGVGIGHPDPNAGDAGLLDGGKARCIVEIHPFAFDPIPFPALGVESMYISMNSLKIPYLIVFIFLVQILTLSNISSANNDIIALSKTELIWLAQKHKVRVRVGNWPPFMFSKGEFKGISVDYIEQIFKLHGIDYQYFSDREIPWNSALEDIKKHQGIDLLLTAKITEGRKEFLSFSDEYIFLPWVIFTRTDAPFVGGLDDLAGKTVSWRKEIIHLKTQTPCSRIPWLLTGPTKNAIGASKYLKIRVAEVA